MSNPQTSPVRSQFANDPDLREIVEMYVQEMPERISSLTQLWSNQQIDELRRVAHQLRGASGGYGFPTVGDAAGRLEKTITSLGDGSASASVDDLRSQFEELLDLCRRVRM